MRCLFYPLIIPTAAYFAQQYLSDSVFKSILDISKACSDMNLQACCYEGFLKLVCNNYGC